MKTYSDLKDSMPDLSGKVFAITGTTSGTGFIAAKTVGEKGGKVLLLNRPSERSTASLAKLKEAVPEADFVSIDCDLQDFESVRSAAKSIKNKGGKALYCLSNNAGIMAFPNKSTKDGYDVQMQTNHLSHFLLTALLFPLLEEGAKKHGDARVVNHSSAARNFVPGKIPGYGHGYINEKYLGKSGPHLGNDKANPMTFSGGCFIRYHHSKLANTVFTHALSKKIASSSSSDVQKIRSIAAHPGVAFTSLATHLQESSKMMRMMTPVFKMMANTEEDATMGLLYGMTMPDAESGFLYGPKNDSFSGPAVRTTLKRNETRERDVEMLWKCSEEATGANFEIK